MEITFEITQFCENGCNYCSSNASPEGQHVPIKTIEKWIKEVKEKSIPIERINISGGEPLAHPDFYCINKMIKESFPRAGVWVYSNVIDKLIFNSDVVKEVRVDADCLIMPGKSTYIPKNITRAHLLRFVKSGRGKELEVSDIKISCSHNFDITDKKCEDCHHITYQADGQIVESPCKKRYTQEE